MRKLVTAALSIFFLLGFTSLVLAENDAAGDNFVPDVDLLSASVVTSSQTNPLFPPELANIGIKMAPGSHLPGLIIFDFDVDDDTTTGTPGQLQIGLNLAEGTQPVDAPPYKDCCISNCGPLDDNPVGPFDFYVVIALREQTDFSQVAYSPNCQSADSLCLERGAQCSGSGDCGTRYQAGTQCVLGDPNCYEFLFDFANCDQGFCPALANECGASGAKRCDMGLLAGEWALGVDIVETGIGVSRGRKILAYDYSIEDETGICLTLPWREILEKAKAAGATFDMAATVNNPPKYAVSIWYDSTFSDQDDFLSAQTVNLVDFLPNEDPPTFCPKANGEFNGNVPCAHNSAGGYGDLSVAADDVADFLDEFGRSTFFEPCPNCEN